MDVIHLSAECYPVAKVGGLGDVVGALPKYLNQAGINASVVLPYYDRKFVQENKFEEVFNSTATAAGKTFNYSVLKEKNRQLGFNLYLIFINGLLDRKEIYCYPDEIKQFISYQVSVVDWISKSVKKPDIIHCHDHHSGLVPFLICHSNLYKDLAKIPTICTIHNGQYQGWLGWDKVGYLPSLDLNKAGLLDWNNCINSLAASVKCCWKFTTVSPNYLKELSVNSNGLEKLFQLEEKRIGIINGIDTQVWNPESDPMIAQTYNIETVDKGKKSNKKSLCKQFELSGAKPLVVFIGRLVGEKGAELLAPAIESCLKLYKGKVNFIVLGSGEPEIEEELEKLKIKHKKQCGIYIGYDEELSHRIYAGADFLMMPSRVEPCGLNQLYAVRYGTMPIVHNTGGLSDTVIDLDDDAGYGLTFERLEVEELVDAVGRALEIHQNSSRMSEMRKKMMSLDFSWDKSAKEYIDLYKSLIIPYAV